MAELTRKPSKLSGLLHKRNPWHKVQKMMGMKSSSADLVVPVVNATVEAHQVLVPTRPTPASALTKKNGPWIQRDDRPPPEEDCQPNAAHMLTTAQHTMATKIQKAQRGASGRKRARSQQVHFMHRALPTGHHPPPGAPCQLHHVLSASPVHPAGT